MSIFTLCLLSFATPSVIVRWAEAEYLIVLLIQTGSLVIYNCVASLKPKSFAYLRPWVLSFINLVFFLVMCVVLGTQDHPFNYSQLLVLYAISFAASLMCLNIQFIWNQMCRTSNLSHFKQLWISVGFLLGSTFILVIILLSSFTNFYFPTYRVRLWMLIIIVVVAATFAPSATIQIPSFIYFNEGDEGPYAIYELFQMEASNWVYNTANKFRFTSKNRKMKTIVISISVVLCVLLIGSIVNTIVLNMPAIHMPRSAPAVHHQYTTTMFNIQQGFDKYGNTNFTSLLESVQLVDPDFIALIDTGASQLYGGNRDFVRYLTNSKKMFSYYGPKQNMGTNGIALLSKYKMRSTATSFIKAGTFREPVAILRAKITLFHNDDDETSDTTPLSSNNNNKQQLSSSKSKKQQHHAEYQRCSTSTGSISSNSNSDSNSDNDSDEYSEDNHDKDNDNNLQDCTQLHVYVTKVNSQQISLLPQVMKRLNRKTRENQFFIIMAEIHSNITESQLRDYLQQHTTSSITSSNSLVTDKSSTTSTSSSLITVNNDGTQQQVIVDKSSVQPTAATSTTFSTTSTTSTLQKQSSSSSSLTFCISKYNYIIMSANLQEQCSTLLANSFPQQVKHVPFSSTFTR